MILVYCYAIAAIVLFLFTKKNLQHNKQRKQVLWVVQWLQQLRDLLELFPKHRGMANAYLKGDTSFRGAMEKLQQEADAKLLSMRRQISERREWSDKRILHAIEEKWQSIKQNVYTMPADRCFYNHSRLIALVIERLEDDALELLGFAQRSTSQQQRHISSIISMLTRELPQVLESIGQARGIGTGVAAQQNSSVANRVNLKYLHSNALSIIDNKLVPLRASLVQQSEMSQHSMESCFENAVNASRQFLNLLKHELIDTPHPTVAPDTYYKQGTVAIEAEFRLFDQLFPQCLKVLGLN